MPATAVIPALYVYINVVVVKTFVVYSSQRVFEFVVATCHFSASFEVAKWSLKGLFKRKFELLQVWFRKRALGRVSKFCADSVLSDEM